jgi:Putative Na+/H+ antiporter
MHSSCPGVGDLQRIYSPPLPFVFPAGKAEFNGQNATVLIPFKIESKCFWLTVLGAFLLAGSISFAAEGTHGGETFPRPLNSYHTPETASLLAVLKERIQAEPFNAVATLLFFLAITHTFMAPMFLRWSHHFEDRHQLELKRTGRADADDVSFSAEIFHFLGEIEAVFGIWVVPLLVALSFSKGWQTARDYLGHNLNFTEPMFVVIIMTMAASRPVLKLAERLMALTARLGKGSVAAWWISILTVGPLLGSFVTEPAAMTISALLLAQKFYALRPSARFAYATLGLLFVNVSVGGTLTHFAAPPVLMVAGKWGWGFSHMLLHFGWKAVIGIALANVLYFLCFRRDFKTLSAFQSSHPPENVDSSSAVPVWITVVHILFLAWTVLNNHFPVLFIGGFLFYLAFLQATEHQQGDLQLRPALLVGFFLAGLVVHGGLQGWWIEPVLSRLTEYPLYFSAMGLTAVNDNAAITYLASLVPGFNDALKYAVVAGAVVGGGLTVIANAPNPAGQSILAKYFPDGVSPWRLFLGALLPTMILAAVFILFR